MSRLDRAAHPVWSALSHHATRGPEARESDKRHDSDGTGRDRLDLRPSGSGQDGRHRPWEPRSPPENGQDLRQHDRSDPYVAWGEPLRSEIWHGWSPPAGPRDQHRAVRHRGDPPRPRAFGGPGSRRAARDAGLDGGAAINEDVVRRPVAAFIAAQSDGRSQGQAAARSVRTPRPAPAPCPRTARTGRSARRARRSDGRPGRPAPCP